MAFPTAAPVVRLRKRQSAPSDNPTSVADPDPSSEPPTSSTPTTSSTTSPSSSEDPTTSSTTPSTTPSSTPTSPSSSTTPSSSPTSSSPTESTSSTPTTTSRSTITSVIETTVTVDGSTFLSSLTSSSAVPVPDNNGGGSGLSSGAKAGIIGGVCGGVGFILLVALGFFLYRWNNRRKSNYTPGGEELKWPDMQEDSNTTLFPAAVRRNSGHGVGGGLDRGDTMLSAGTAGVASSSRHSYQPAAYPNSNYGAEGAAAAAAYPSYPPQQQQQYYEDAPQQGYYNGNEQGYYEGQGQDPYYNQAQGQGYGYPDQQDQNFRPDDAYDGQADDQRPISGAPDLDRYGSVMSRSERPGGLHVANV